MDTPTAYNIKTYNAIAPVGLQRFAAGNYTVGPDMEGADAMLLRSHKLSTDELTPGLRAIARAGAGVNNVPVEACSKAGIVVFNTPGANANSVKELVLTGLLLASRDVRGSLRRDRRHGILRSGNRPRRRHARHVLTAACRTAAAACSAQRRGDGGERRSNLRRL